MDDTKLKIREIKWYYDSTRERYLPHLKLHSLASKSQIDIELDSYTFNFELSSEKRCPGICEEDELTCYSNYSEISGSTELCFACEERIGFKDAFFRGIETNIEIQQYLGKPHNVYLALFANNRIKVGTTSLERENLRLVEQDALAYSFIFEGENATQAREVEKDIARKFGITESVRSSYKLKHLSRKLDEETGRKLLQSMYAKISASSSFVNLDFAYKPISNEIPYYFPDSYYKVSFKRYVSGRFMGLRGRYMLIENNEEKEILFDVRELVGRTIVGYPASRIKYITPEEQVSFGL